MLDNFGSFSIVLNHNCPELPAARVGFFKNFEKHIVRSQQYLYMLHGHKNFHSKGTKCRIIVTKKVEILK